MNDVKLNFENCFRDMLRIEVGLWEFIGDVKEKRQGETGEVELVNQLLIL